MLAFFDKKLKKIIKRRHLKRARRTGQKLTPVPAPPLPGQG